MLNKKNLLIAAAGTAAAAFFLITPHVQGQKSGQSGEAVKLEGAWIMRFPGTPFLDVFTLSPSDPSGRRASVSGYAVVGDPTLLGNFPDAQWQTPLVGESVMTGWDRGVFTVVSYGAKLGATGLQEIVYIMVDSGTWQQIAPGKLQHHHNAAIYLPAQDMDGDGLPDSDQSPVACIALTSTDTRVPLLPPCTPPGPPSAAN